MPDGDEHLTIRRQDAELLRRAQLLLDGLYTDPDLGMPFKELLKKKFPKLSIPEIDAAKPHIDALEALKKEWKEFREKNDNDKLEAEYVKRFDDVRSEFHLTDEGLEAVKKRMVKDNIADPRAAAALVTHETPKPIEPSSFGQNRWDFFGSTNKEELDDLKALVSDPDGWMDRQIPKILAEERNKARLPVTI